MIKKSVHSDKALHKLESFISKDINLRSLVGTTQAIDLIGGGVKVNALPETAWAVVNHRIATQRFAHACRNILMTTYMWDSSVGEVQDRDTALLQKLADKFNLSYTAFGKGIQTGDGQKYGTLDLSDAWGTSLEPAPVTPTGQDAVAFQVLSGTIKTTFREFRREEGDVKDIIIAPGIMTGNTGSSFFSTFLARRKSLTYWVDTRYYWKLTKHIFRYNHHNTAQGSRLAGVHTVNEGIFSLIYKLCL